MRKRKWALFAFIFMLAFIFVSLESWRLFKANEKLKEFILAEFRPIVGEQLHISKVHVSFGNIHILDVRLSTPEQNISIDIRDLRIGYNFFNLLVRGFDPQYISQDALFIGPKITIRAASDSLSTHVVTLDGEMRSTNVFVSPSFKELNLFSNISIKDGEIVYAENDSTPITLVHSVQGGLYKQPSDSFFIHLDGAFYHSQTHNINIVGNGDYKALRFARIKATLADYELAHGFPLLDKKTIHLDRGQVGGDIDIHWSEWRKRYAVGGNLKINDGGGNLFTGKLVVRDILADLLIQDDKVLIQELHLVVNNSKVKITGAAENLRTPVLNLQVESPEFEIAEFSPLLGTNSKISGKSTFNAAVHGPLDNLIVYNKVRAKTIKLNNTVLQHFYVDAIYDGKTMVIDSSSAFLKNNHLALAGAIDLSAKEKTIQGRLDGYGDGLFSPATLLIDSSIVMAASFTSNLSGSLTSPIINGNLYLDANSKQDSLALAASFKYENKKLTIKTNPQSNGILVNTSFDWQQSPPLLTVECQRLEQLLYFFWNIPAENYFAENLRSSLTAYGNLNRFTVNTQIIAMSGGRVESELLRLHTEVERQMSRIKSDGAFVIRAESEKATSGKFSIEKNGSVLKMKKFDVEKKVSAYLNIDFAHNRDISGAFVSQGFDISRLTAGSDSSLSGKMDADLKIDGTLKALLLDGYIHFQDLLYDNVGPYESIIDFDYNSSIFRLKKFLLNFGMSTLLFAQGNYDSKNDKVDFTLKGAGFDAGQVLGAAGKDSLISGEALVDLGIKGSAKTPEICGIIAIQNGHLANIPFDEIELKLGASADSSTAEQPSIFIDKFRLSRFNVYEILAHGYYPFRNTDPLYLDVNGRGNFLQVLNDITPFFKSPQSMCILQSRVRGTPKSPQLEDANVKIANASLEFKSVVAPISDVFGELDFNADEQFLHLSRLEGNMGVKPFKIHNELADNVVSAKPLNNIHIGDSEFHFGVLVLETPQKGVPLNFIGLMEPNEFGLLDLSGRESGEQFYFAAVPEGLTLRGRIDLYDAEIMYPFYEGVKIGSSRVSEFLKNLNWDLLVVPTKNTRFVRNFPGAIDEVYVDLKLDEGFGGLEITDRLENETFRINGHVRSTKGFIEYLDMNFRVEQAGVEFDRSSLVPVAYGNAKTTVTDSLGISSNILLTLQTVDNTMDKKNVDDIVRQEEERARFDQIRFKLTSDNPNIGSSEAQIMASLGYSTSNLQNSAVSAIGYGTDNLIFRPLFRPVEKEIEQTFGFDYVRFSSQLTRNIIMFNLNDNIELNSRLALLESTKIIVGKYLANRFFLQYTGQIESGVGYRYKEKHLGLHHTLGLEYQINPQVLVELEYDYDSLMLENRDDKRIILRHWFPF